MKRYIETEILPRYEAFDKAHQRDHADYVIRQSLELARHYDVDMNMVYVIAAFTTLVLQSTERHIISNRERLSETILNSSNGSHLNR